MKPNIKKILLPLFICTLLLSPASAELTAKINSIITRNSQEKTHFSIHIAEPETSTTIYEHNAHEAVLPASNMKIIITAAALELLGPDFAYKTSIGLCSDSVVVIGDGDPLLADPITDTAHLRPPNLPAVHTDGWLFDDIIKNLKLAGVTRIKDIIIDTSIFDDRRVHPNWPADQLNKWYACEVSGLNYNTNCIEMTVENLNGRAVVHIQPDTDFIQIKNEVKVNTNVGSAVGAYRIGGKLNHLVVKGRCKKRTGPFKVAIQRPAALFGYILAEKLIEANIPAEGQLLVQKPPSDCNFQQVCEYTTGLDTVLARCNKDSLSLAAEALTKTIAAKTKSPPGSWQKARNVITDYLIGIGVNKSEFYIDDASGLSRQNRLSAYALTTTLTSVYKSRHWQKYKRSLAKGGIDGTIEKFFNDKRYRGKILGKTGYIAGVKSFSGLCITDRGDYIFSILANNANGKTRSAINDIAKAIIDEYSHSK